MHESGHCPSLWKVCRSRCVTVIFYFRDSLFSNSFFAIPFPRAPCLSSLPTRHAPASKRTLAFQNSTLFLSCNARGPLVRNSRPDRAADYREGPGCLESYVYQSSQRLAQTQTPPAHARGRKRTGAALPHRGHQQPV